MIAAVRRIGAAAATLFALAAAPATAAVGETELSFAVHNTNTTTVPCSSDGGDYTVRGALIAPTSGTPSSVTLYLHAVTWDRNYFDFKGVPGYAFASELADRGHASVLIDRLGYGASDKPPGRATCFGSAADVAHQVVQALRSGAYRTKSGDAPTFAKVFIAGSSVGGLIANLEAEAFGDVDGVINQSWGDITASPYVGGELVNVVARCAQGGDAGAPLDYAAFARDTSDTFYFNSATPDVRAAVPPLRPDPCGELESLPQAIGVDSLTRSQIDVPVLVSFGDADAVFGPSPLHMEQTAARYTGSPAVTTVLVPDASHFPLIEVHHEVLLDAADAWLGADGMVAPTCRKHRVVRIRTRVPRRFKVRRIAVRIKGEVVAMRSGRARRIGVDLTGRPAGKLRVNVRIRVTRHGRTRTVRRHRTFDLCPV
jgi:pimeloyl-ACP methyl ester carboxylesterase